MTADEILALARAALEDDRSATPGPWRFGVAKGGMFLEDARGYRFGQVDDDENGFFVANARTREPALAKWVKSVLDAEANEGDAYASTATHNQGLVVVYPNEVDEAPFAISQREARALAASLLRAADKADATKDSP